MCYYAADLVKSRFRLDAIQRAAKTEKIGDGKIFVLNLESAMRIRTGETGSDAL